MLQILPSTRIFLRHFDFPVWDCNSAGHDQPADCLPGRVERRSLCGRLHSTQEKPHRMHVGGSGGMFLGLKFGNKMINKIMNVVLENICQKYKISETCFLYILELRIKLMNIQSVYSWRISLPEKVYNETLKRILTELKLE